MSTLHTVNKSPFTNNALLSCIKHCKDGDAILLIEDGVYGALAASTIADTVSAALNNVALYVLDGDASARGIAADKVLSGAKSVGYDGFVDLVAEHDRTEAWL
ncbi:MAG: sulfurtransferase complex subunit TusB [Ruegeria sp.]